MVDPITFWSDHLPDEAIAIALRLVGEAVRFNRGDFFNDYHVRRIGYAPDFDLAKVESQLRKELDEIGWIFVTTGERIEKLGESWPAFCMSPIVPRTLTIGYHATRSCLIPRILSEGLLPSNAERQATNFDDTEGVIHVCGKLTHIGEENDSAEWWRRELSQRNRFNDPNWGIIRIDMTQLPASARVYQDMHSKSGVIVDRIDKIPGRMITEIRQESVQQ